MGASQSKVSSLSPQGTPKGDRHRYQHVRAPRTVVEEVEPQQTNDINNHQEYCEKATILLNHLMDVSNTSSLVQHQVASYINNITAVVQGASMGLQGYLIAQKRKTLFHGGGRARMMRSALTLGILAGNYWAWKPITKMWTDFTFVADAYQTLSSQIESFKHGRMSHLVGENSRESREEILRHINHYIYEKMVIDRERVIVPSLYDQFKKSSNTAVTDVVQMYRRIEETEQRVIAAEDREDSVYAEMRREMLKLQDIMTQISQHGMHGELVTATVCMTCPTIQLYALSKQKRYPWIILSLLALPLSAALSAHYNEVCKTHADFKASEEALLRDLRTELYLNVRTEQQIAAFAKNIDQVSHDRNVELTKKPLIPPLTFFDQEIEI